MRYIILAFAMMLLTVGTASGWEPPDTCADEDREIPGNRSTPCKLVLPEIPKLEYRITMAYPYCREYMAFVIPGLKSRDLLNQDENGIKIRYMGAMTRTWSFGVEQELDWLAYGRILDGGIISKIRSYRLDSKFELESEFGNPDIDRPNVRIGVAIRGEAEDYSIYSNWVPRPTTHSKTELLNSCLALVKQEREDRLHQAEQERLQRETEARLKAEADARAKEETQAKREAETQALIAAQELEAATAARLKIAEIELLRTKTLHTQLQHEEVIAAILNDIVLIRLAGQEDRARITNEHLARLARTTSDLDQQTEEVTVRINEYVEFNARLLAEIERYRTELFARLQSTNDAVKAQEAKIEQVRVDYENAVAELEKLQEAESGGN